MYLGFLIFSALFGALVATYIGYRFRCLENDESVMYEMYALMASVVVMVIVVLGPFDWTLFADRKMLTDLVVVVSFVAIMMGYCRIVVLCAIWGEELDYPASVRKARRKSRNRNIKAVVTVSDVERALRRYAQQEYDAELERMVDLVDGIDWVDLDKDDDPSTIFVTSQVNSNLPMRAVAKPAQNSRVITRPTAVNTAKALVRHLRLDDLHLVIEAFRREPALFYMLRSPKLFAKLEIVGKGSQKCIKIKGAAYLRR